jgi:hypothetical protein
MKEYKKAFDILGNVNSKCPLSLYEDFVEQESRLNPLLSCALNVKNFEATVDKADEVIPCRSHMNFIFTVCLLSLCTEFFTTVFLLLLTLSLSPLHYTY